VIVRDARRQVTDLGPTPATSSIRPGGVIATPVPAAVLNRLAQRRWKARQRAEKAA